MLNLWKTFDKYTYTKQLVSLSIKSQRLQEEIELLQKKLQQVQSENSEIKAALSASENQNETLQNDLK